MTPEEGNRSDVNQSSSSSPRFSRNHRNLLSSLLSRQLLPDKSQSSSILNPCYRPLVRKSYRRATAKARKVFKTKIDANSVFGGSEINPVYDIAYSPVAYQDHRVIAVGDELGYLSIVKVGFEGGIPKGKGKGEGISTVVGDCGDPVFNRGVQSVAPAAPGQQRNDDSFGNEDDQSPHMQPVLYNLAWNWEGNKILTGYGDGSIRIWDLEKSSKPICTSTIQAFDKSLKRVAWCQEIIISCSRTNEILVHDQRMRNPLTNRIDCSQLGCKLTDVCVVSDVNVVASSSNQSSINLFDLRYTYKLYKRIKPVESFDLSSPGYTTIKYDTLADDGMVYTLGSDSIVRSFDYRSGVVGASYRVPGIVDFFTKIDVDRFSGILVSGSTTDSAWGFDLWSPYEKGSHLMPFFELREGKKVTWGEDGPGDDDVGDLESDKENQRELGVGGGEQVEGRYCSAIALGTRRGFQDCAVQIACGGDNSTILVFD